MSMIETLSTLDRHKRYVIGVSFGVDSMVLLDVARQAGLQLVIAHVNYHKRAESDLDQTQLEQYAFEHDLPVYVLDVQSKAKGNFQAWARDVRYDFFVELVSQGLADAILLAHHQDDFIETGYLQEKRGGWIRYWGIEDHSTYQEVDVYRPFLNVTKEDLYAYQKAMQIPYGEDSSNHTFVYERNRVRALLKTWSPSQKQTYRKQMDLYNLGQRRLKETLTPFLVSFKLSLETYKEWNDAKQRMAWYVWFSSKGIHQSISDTWMQRMKGWLVSKKPNLLYGLDGGWTLYKAYDHFALLHHDDLQPFAYQLHKPQVIDHPLFTFDGVAYRLSPYPVVLRSMTQEDSIKGVNMTKSMQRLMIDEKVPAYLRGCYPILSKGKTAVFAYPHYQKKVDTKDQEWLVFK